MPLHVAKLVPLALLSILCLAPNASAIIMYPGDTGTTNKPYDDVMARWGSNASAVVIGRDLVLTTKHQGGGVGSVVNVGGTNYAVAQVWDEPGGADIRVARLAGANLSHHVGIYSGSDEPGMTVTIGGFGWGRGAPLLDSQGVLYGYAWDSQSANNVQRWGENVVLGTDATDTGTQLLYDSFSNPSGPYALPHEAAIAMWDSGGGWLYNSGSDWYVVALSRAVSHLNESWFRDPFDPYGGADINDAVRVSSYSPWLATFVPEPMTLAMLALGGGWIVSRRRRTTR